MSRNTRNRNNRRTEDEPNFVGILFLVGVVGYLFLGIRNVWTLLILSGLIWGVIRWIKLNNGLNSLGRTIQQQGTSQHQQTSAVDPVELDRMRENAFRAMQRAGRNPKESPLRLNDIGLLVYEGSKQPQIFRTAEVGTDASHIRPFMVLENPDMHSTGQGTIRFNLIDERGQLRFTNRSRYTVKPGQNFITPPTWLPLQEQRIEGKWMMQVNIGDSTLFAVHEFNWFAVGGEVRAQFTGDGEIDEVAYHYDPGESLSLDELLASQGEAAPLAMGSHR